MNHRRPSPSRGFATITAVFMMTLVATATLALTQQFGIEARRTQSTRIEAQLRQILHAAISHAVRLMMTSDDNVAKTLANPLSLDLPASLKSRQASAVLTLQTAGKDRLVHVEALFDGHKRKQTLYFSPLDGRWKLAKIEILPAS